MFKVQILTQTCAVRACVYKTSLFHGFLTLKERLPALRVVPPLEGLAHRSSGVKAIKESRVAICTFPPLYAFYKIF